MVSKYFVLMSSFSRNQSDGTDRDGVTDLYGLVSKILEDDDSSDHLSHTERCVFLFFKNNNRYLKNLNYASQ